MGKKVCVVITEKPDKPCPGKPDEYIWVNSGCKEGYWRKRPSPRAKKAKINKELDADLLKTIKLLQKALLRYAGSIDPKSLADAGKQIKGVKIVHASGAKNKYKHPSGIGKRSGYVIQYACVNLHDLITSHKPFENFAPDKRFPNKIQDRDYTKKAEKNKVIDIALKLQPEYMLSQAVTAAEGTPIITHDMIVLSGNGRVQALKYASENSPANYEKYKLEALEAAPRFAILRDEIKQFEHPVIVRFVNINAKTQEAVDFGHAANSKIGAERSEVREAAHIAEILPPEMLALIKDADETKLSGILDQKEFRTFLKNAIAVKDQQKYFKDTGKLTDSGKIFIKKVLLIKCLGSPETLENMTEQHLLMFTNALPALVEVRQRESTGQIGSQYSISGLISEALRFLREEILNEGYKNFEDFKTQKSFLKKGKAKRETSEFLKVLENIDKKGKLLTFYLIQLAKDATAESNLRSGMFADVGEQFFYKIIKDAYEKAENSYKLYKQKGIKDNLTPAMFSGYAANDKFNSIVKLAGEINSNLSETSREKHLKLSRSASRQGNVALALKHLSSALNKKARSVHQLGDTTMKKLDISIIPRLKINENEIRSIINSKLKCRTQILPSAVLQSIETAIEYYKHNKTGKKGAACDMLRAFNDLFVRNREHPLINQYMSEIDRIFDMQGEKFNNIFRAQDFKQLGDTKMAGIKTKIVRKPRKSAAKKKVAKKKPVKKLKEAGTKVKKGYKGKAKTKQTVQPKYPKKTKSKKPAKKRKKTELGGRSRLNQIVKYFYEDGRKIVDASELKKVADALDKKGIRADEIVYSKVDNEILISVHESDREKVYDLAKKLKMDAKRVGTDFKHKFEVSYNELGNTTQPGDFDFIPKLSMTKKAQSVVNKLAKDANGASVEYLADKLMKNLRNAGRGFRALRKNDGSGQGRGRRPHPICIKAMKIEFKNPKDAEIWSKKHLFRALAAKKVLEKKAPENETLKTLEGYLQTEKSK